MKNMKVLFAENMNPKGEDFQPSLLVQFDSHGASYILTHSDYSTKDKGRDFWTVLYDANEYLTCERDRTVPHALYEEWLQYGNAGTRGNASKELKEDAEQAISVVKYNLLQAMGKDREKRSKKVSLRRPKKNSIQQDFEK